MVNVRVSLVREGVGLPTLLFLAFLLLRLAGLTDWPWYVVASPLLVTAGIWAIVLAVVLLSIAVDAAASIFRRDGAL